MLIKCSLHNHSTNSDGKLKPEKMVRAIANKGYKVIALTDHDWITYIREEDLPKDIIYLTGYELSKPNLHIIKLETPSRNRPDLARIDFLAHPARWGMSTSEILKTVREYKLDGVEYCNSKTIQYSERIKGIIEVGVDDSHNENMILWNWIELETDSFDKETIIEMLKKGEFVIKSR